MTRGFKGCRNCYWVHDPNEPQCTLKASVADDCARAARALALLDRVGDAAADALIKGEAAVVRDDEVPMPRNADQAAGMTFLGHRWLQQHAPDRLTAAGRLDREGE
jgi:hypothetical protein